LYAYFIIGSKIRILLLDLTYGRTMVTIVNPAKTAEPFEMPFGIWTRVGERNY